MFSNLLKPPSRLNIQVLTESRTYLPPSDGPVKDCRGRRRAPENSCSEHCHSSREPCSGALLQSPGRPLKLEVPVCHLSWDPVLSASACWNVVEVLTEASPRVPSIYQLFLLVAAQLKQSAILKRLLKHTVMSQRVWFSMK